MQENPARVLPNTCRVIKVYLNYVEFDEKKGIGTTQTKKAGCGKGKLYFYFSTLGKNGAGWGSMDADAVIKNYQ